MDIIFCRNVMIYFNKNLVNKIIGLFCNSLPIGGFLCLGLKETLRFSDYEDCFKEYSKNMKIYQKIK